MVEFWIIEIAEKLKQSKNEIVEILKSTHKARFCAYSISSLKIYGRKKLIAAHQSLAFDTQDKNELPSV